MRKTKVFVSIALSLTLVLGMTGCSDIERKTFQTLTASKSIVDDADALYRSGAIARTDASFQAITAARDAQVLAVTAFDSYDDLRKKMATGVVPNDPAALSAKEQAVFAALADVIRLTAPVKALVADIKKVGKH